MRRVLWAVALGILLSGARGAVAQPDPSCTASTASQARVDAVREAAGVPGLSVAVLRGNTLCETATSGVVNTQTGRPVTTQSVFEAASLTKPVLAYLILRQVADGNLALDTRVADVLPHLHAQTPYAAQVTLRHLLTHTTGVPTDDDTTAVRPGTRFGYASQNYRWAQAVLEDATGEPLDVHARSALFDPQAMTHSRFVWSSSADVGMMGHDGAEPRRPIRHAETPDGAAGLVTTAADYARFVEAVLRGDGLPPELQTAFLAPQTTVEGWRPGPATDVLRWGLGWGLERTASNAAADTSEASFRIWHWGDNGHFESFVHVNPVTGDGLVVLTNGTRGLKAVRGLLHVYFPANDAARALDWLDVAPLGGPDVTRTLRRSQATDVRRLVRSASGARPFHPERAGPVVDALAARGASDEAVLLGRRIVLEHPRAWRSHLLLAEAYRSSDNPIRAREHLFWALAFGADPDLIRPRLRWLAADVQGDDACEELAAQATSLCSAHAPSVPDSAYAGVYETVTVRMRDDTLTWSTRGRVEAPLVRVTGHTFTSRDDASVRLAFEVDAGRVTGVAVQYYGGGAVRYGRTPPTHDAPSRDGD